MSVPLIPDAALAMMTPGFPAPGSRRQNGDNSGQLFASGLSGARDHR